MTHETTLRRIEKDVGELIARHEAGRDLRDFRSYRDRPVAFIREVLGAEPWSKQEEIARAVRDDPLVAVRSCNAAGKDWIAARLALWWVYARNGMVLLTGPTERQVVEVCMSEVGSAFGSVGELPGSLYRTALRVEGSGSRSGILAFTSTEASRLTGFHAPRVLAVLTEAQGVEDFAWEGLLACATGTEDRVLAVGNPLLPSGRFFTVSRKPQWRSIQISADEHPNIRVGRTVVPGGPSAAFVERIRSEYGEGSPIYSARVLGEFPDEGEEGLFRRSWLEASAERWDPEGVSEGPAIVAVDPARFGPDETVCAVRRGDVLTELVAWRGTDLMETVDRIRAVLDRVGVTPGEHPTTRLSTGTPARSWTSGARKRSAGLRPVGRVIVDEVGLGGGVADRLRELGYRVEGYNGGHAAGDPERFMNRRAESYWGMRRGLEAGRIALPRDEKLFDELVALRWRPTADGKVRLEAKEELRGRIGRSPDRADAVVMALAESEKGTRVRSWRSAGDRLGAARVAVAATGRRSQPRPTPTDPTGLASASAPHPNHPTALGVE